MRVQASGFELFQGRRWFRPARWPKRGFATDISQSRSPPKQATIDLRPAGANFDRWKGEKDLWIGGYLSYDWLFETAPAAPVDGGILRLTVDRQAGSFPVRRTFPFFIFNATSELSEPGEYVLNSEKKQIAYIPFAGEAPIEIAVARGLLRVTDASHIRIERIAFEKTLGTPIRIAAGQEIRISDCLVGLSGKDGIEIIGGSNVTVERSVVSQVSERGIVLAGGDRQTLAAGRHTVRDSIVTWFGVDSRTYRPGIELRGVGLSVIGSAISESPHSGIIISGNENTVRENELFSLSTEASDAGAIYMGRDWTKRGNAIENNYFHDIGNSRPKSAFISGVYLDDQLSGTVIAGNTFARVGQPIVLGGGRDNTIERNRFTGMHSAGIWIDDRGLNTHTQNAAQLMANLAKVDINSPVWRQKYPSLAGILQDDPHAPKGNVVRNNVAVGGKVIQFRTPAVAKYVEETGSVELPAGESGAPRDDRDRSENGSGGEGSPPPSRRAALLKELLFAGSISLQER